MKKPKIALALSGGSALGFAHIGVIEVLEKNGIRPDIIVGTSMGSVIGGAYASGMSINEIKEASLKMSKGKFFDANLFRGGGIFGGKQINKIFQVHYGDKKIEDTKIKFACVGVDMVTAEQVIFKSGSLKDAVRVSMNIPALFSPIISNGRSLVDGGLLNNIPDDIAKEMGADIIIAVDVMTGTYRKQAPKSVQDTIISTMHLMIVHQQKNRKKFADIEIIPYIETEKNIHEMSYEKNKIQQIIDAGTLACEKNIEAIKKLLTKTTLSEKKTVKKVSEKVSEKRKSK